MGIYHKVDDFNFEVISFPFPCSNIHIQIGYSSFYSQLVRYFRLCNNVTDFIVRVKMLKDKLSSRGYSIETLRKNFLRFCLFYPAPLKYGSSDVVLWDMTSGTVFGGSCCVYDQDAVKKLIKPCSIRLTDIGTVHEKQGQSSISPTVEGQHPSVDNDLPIACNRDNLCVPIPLFNPSNHCYLNSIIQVLFRFKDILSDNIYLNDNREGQIVKSLLENLSSHSETDMANFKTDLSYYNPFFDGTVQRDVYECFQGILRIMHEGTRRSLLDQDEGVGDDEFVTSITKSKFSFVLKKTLTCNSCDKSSVFFIPTSDFHIYPSNLRNIESLMADALKSSLQKGCDCSDENVCHLETLEFEDYPSILFIVVNRYSFNLSSSKNSCFIVMESELNIKDRIYDHAATIYHHGEHTSSGHYTAKVVYTGGAYMCDDHTISPLDIIYKEKSKSCYLIMYLRRD